MWIYPKIEVDGKWTRLRPSNDDLTFVPGPRDAAVIGRTIPYNSLFLWGGEDNAVQFSAAWEFVFSERKWYLIELNDGADEPIPRSTPCSAISSQNSVFMFGGQPLASSDNRGSLGKTLDDLWSFDGGCPGSLPTIQGANAAAGGSANATTDLVVGANLTPDSAFDPEQNQLLSSRVL